MTRRTVKQVGDAAEMTFITLENIRTGEVNAPALRGISLSIAQNEFLTLMGASGSGKTMLMNIADCLDRPGTGPYWLNG